MKINSTNKLNFKALIVNDDNQTREQKKIIKTILKNNYLTKELIDNLEEQDTDIFVSANPDGKSVDLKLQTDSFYGLSYIPYDKNGRKYQTTIVASPDKTPRQVFIHSSLFFKRAENLDLSTPKNMDTFNHLLDD